MLGLDVDSFLDTNLTIITANAITAMPVQEPTIIGYIFLSPITSGWLVARSGCCVTVTSCAVLFVATSSLVTLAVPVFVRFSVMDLLLSAIPVSPPFVLLLLSAVPVEEFDSICVISFPVALTT